MPRTADPERPRPHPRHRGATCSTTTASTRVGLQQVIDEYGCGKNLLYREFPSKDDLVVAWLERCHAEWEAPHRRESASRWPETRPAQLVAIVADAAETAACPSSGAVPCATPTPSSPTPTTPRTASPSSASPAFAPGSASSPSPGARTRSGRSRRPVDADHRRGQHGGARCTVRPGSRRPPSPSPRTSSRPLCRSTYPPEGDALKLVFVVDETAGLVPTPLPTPMLQPYEVYDQALFDQEMVRVFARSWVWLGDTEDLQEPGDFITGADRVPGGDRHPPGGRRGQGFPQQLPAPGVGPRVRARRPLRQDADLPVPQLGVRDRRPADRRSRRAPDVSGRHCRTSEYGLVPIRVEVAWDKLVFACLSHRAPSFDEWIAPLAERYDRYQFGKMHALPPRPRRDVPDQLEGVLRELERRLPRPLRPPPPQQDRKRWTPSCASPAGRSVATSRTRSSSTIRPVAAPTSPTRTYAATTPTSSIPT